MILLAIEEVRIDDRLIHGQVCSYWVPFFDIERIVVVDKTIASDEQRKAVLRFGCPAGVKATFWVPDKAAEKFAAGVADRARVMILTATPLALVDMMVAGFRVSSVDVGNMSTKPNAVQITNNAFASQDEIRAFSTLIDSGVSFASRMRPNDNPVDLVPVIKRYMAS